MLDPSQGGEPTTFLLGSHPYVVIECPPAPGTAAGFDMKVKVGGVENHDDLTCLLLMAVESLTGVDAGRYLHQVDEVRRAAGLVSLRVRTTGRRDNEPGA